MQTGANEREAVLRRWLPWLLWSIVAVAAMVAARRAALRWSDFIGYIECGEAVLAGTYRPFDTTRMPYWVWPPFFAYLCVPAALLGRVGELGPRLAWFAVNIGLLALVIRLWVLPLLDPQDRRLGLPLVLVATLSFTTSTVVYHQINLLVLALLVGGVVALEKRNETLAGVLIGLAGGIKVWPAFLLPWLWFRGAKRTFLAAAITGGLTLVAPVLLFGPGRAWELTRAWLEHGGPRAGGVHEGRNQALNGILSRLLTDEPWGLAGVPTLNIADLDPGVVARLAQILGGLILLIMSWQVARRRTRPIEELALLAPASLLLLSPLLWRHYLVALLGGAALVIGRMLRGDRPPVAAIALWILLCLAQEPAITGEWISRAVLSFNGNFVLTVFSLILIERARRLAPGR